MNTEEPPLTSCGRIALMSKGFVTFEINATEPPSLLTTDFQAPPIKDVRGTNHDLLNLFHSPD